MKDQNVSHTKSGVSHFRRNKAVKQLIWRIRMLSPCIIIPPKGKGKRKPYCGDRRMASYFFINIPIIVFMKSTGSLKVH